LHVDHESPKHFQLDLFTPDDGHFEYSAVATNLTLALPALYAFICGRGAQEKTVAELKGEFALDVIPTRHYGANSAWQQLSILAHNLIRSFQLDTIAVPKPRSRKRTYTYLIRSMRTVRFLLVTRAGRLARVGGRHVCILPTIPPPRPSMRPSTNASPPKLFSDWGWFPAQRGGRVLIATDTPSAFQLERSPCRERGKGDGSHLNALAPGAALCFDNWLPARIIGLRSTWCREGGTHVKSLLLATALLGSVSTPVPG